MRQWRLGEFELVVSPSLLAELERAFGYPKLARLTPPGDGDRLVAFLTAEAETAADPAQPPPIRSEDPGDDYLLALSLDRGAALVSGDKHLLAFADELPVYSPADFLGLLSQRDPE